MMSSTLSSCGKSSEQDKFSNPALQEKAASRANEISTGALDILEKHVGKQEETVAALRKYISQNREEVLGLRRYFNTARERMSAEHLKSFEEKMKAGREALHIRAESLLRTFEDHMAVRRVLKLVY
jgi:flagellar motility protein MotE (MotC chaperone)